MPKFKIEIVEQSNTDEKKKSDKKKDKPEKDEKPEKKKVTDKSDVKKKVKTDKDSKKSKKDTKKSGKNETHECEHIIRPNNGEQRQCCKNAIREFEGHWYCGTENNGHFKSHSTGKSTIKASPKKGKSKKEYPSVIRRFVLEKRLKCDVKTIKGVKYWVEFSHKIVFDPETKEAVGVKDGDNIRKLDKKECEFVEAYRYVIRKGCAENYSKDESDDEDPDDEEPVDDGDEDNDSVSESDVDTEEE